MLPDEALKISQTLSKKIRLCLLACLFRILALREVRESKLLLAFGQCIMKLLGSIIPFLKQRLILKIKMRERK